jgi:hypothetical protein
LGKIVFGDDIGLTCNAAQLCIGGGCVAAAAAAEKAAAAAKAEEHKKAQAAAADAARGKLRLIYWGGRGLMEPARMMCALSGTPFTDERHSWGNAMPEGAVVEANLGRMPVCVTPSGVSIGQSPANWHYVAESTGMLGANATEAATIFAFASHFKELPDAFTALVPYGTEPTAAAFAASSTSARSAPPSAPSRFGTPAAMLSGVTIGVTCISVLLMSCRV